jgi:hypothetical protein
MKIPLLQLRPECYSITTCNIFQDISQQLILYIFKKKSLIKLDNNAFTDLMKNTVKCNEMK